MRKKILMLLPMCILLYGLFSYIQPVYAEDFAGNESYYMEYCSQPRANEQEAQICRSFKEYYNNKSNNLDQRIDDLNSKIASIQGDMDQINAVIKQQQDIIENLEQQIAANDASIISIQANIDTLNVQIEETQEKIKLRDAQVKERMLAEQPNLGTNIYMDFIMGAADIVDLMRIVEGIARITENDQELIQSLNADKEKLKLDQSEQQRLGEAAADAKEENEKNKQRAQEIKNQQEPLLVQAQSHYAALEEEKRNAAVNAEEVRNQIANINTDIRVVEQGSAEDDGSSGNVVVPPASGGWIKPINGSRSAGTWYYPGGGVHLGTDVAVGVHAPIYAPASGYILHASNPYGTYSGYFGCSDGFIWGAGNTILMVSEVNGTTYAISFAHMAQENFNARSGTSVSQGTQLGGVGASGNTTGPHSHVEVINLGNIGMARAIAVYNAYHDFAFGTGWGAQALQYTCQNTGWNTPCRERPESIFGY